MDLRDDGAWNEGHLSLRVRHHEADRSTALRIETTDHNEGGLWTTQLLAVDKGEESWLSLTVSSARGNFVKVPNLAKFLIQALPLRDGASNVVEHVRIVDGRGVDDLIDLIVDPARRLPAFVAGSDDRLPFGSWEKQMAEWFRQVYGVGHGIVLTPDATAAFAQRMPPAAEARPWAIRTYLRDVANDDSATLRRHRFLGTKRLAEMKTDTVADLLGRVARDQTSRRAVSTEIVAWERRFSRITNAELVKGEPTPLAPPDVSEPRQHDHPATLAPSSAEIARLLGLQVLDIDSLALIKMQVDENEALRARLRDVGRRLEEYEAHTQALEDENETLEELTDDLNLELRIAEDEQIGAEDEIRRLRGALASAGRAEEAYDESGLERTEIPETYEDLLTAVEGLKDRGVIFTGDRDDTLPLEQVDTAGKCLSSAWRACLALVDYVALKRAGTIDQDVHWYLEHGPSGRKVPPRTHARGETAETLKRFGNERVFRVPIEVDVSESRQMVAHFKLGRLARQDPRLYYFDDTPNTGGVYIGYIGRHLTNIQTSHS